MATVVHVCDWCKTRFIARDGIVLTIRQGEHFASYAFCSRECRRAWMRSIAALPDTGIDTGRGDCDSTV